MRNAAESQEVKCNLTLTVAPLDTRCEVSQLCRGLPPPENAHKLKLIVKDRRHLFNIRKSRTRKSRLLTSKEDKRSYKILIIPDQFSLL